MKRRGSMSSIRAVLFVWVTAMAAFLSASEREAANPVQTMPNTIAARKPNETIAASTFSRILSSIVSPLTAEAAQSCGVPAP